MSTVRTDPRPKRFYKDVTVEQADGGWAVLLDGRHIRTPASKAQTVPTSALAALLAAEWDAQGEHLDLASMHAVRLANAALDRTPGVRTELCEEVRTYAGTDLVCHLSDTDATLRDAQEAAWAPLRDWAWEALGVALEPVYGVIALDQPAASLDAARDAAAAMDDFRLTGFTYAMGLLGSVVLAFALERERIDAETAFALSRIDEAHQESRWGVDEEAAQRVQAMARELHTAQAYLRALSEA